MRLAKRENNEILIGEKIESVDGLDNSQMVYLERGDKKNLKGLSTLANKNMTSVKRIKECLATNAAKKAKALKNPGCYCVVCVEEWTTNANGICNHCALS